MSSRSLIQIHIAVEVTTNTAVSLAWMGLQCNCLVPYYSKHCLNGHVYIQRPPKNSKAKAYTLSKAAKCKFKKSWSNTHVSLHIPQ